MFAGFSQRATVKLIIIHHLSQTSDERFEERWTFSLPILLDTSGNECVFSLARANSLVSLVDELSSEKFQLILSAGTRLQGLAICNRQTRLTFLNGVLNANERRQIPVVMHRCLIELRYGLYLHSLVVSENGRSLKENYVDI